MYFISTMCGRPQGEEGVRRMWTGGQKRDFLVDVINGWPLSMPVHLLWGTDSVIATSCAILGAAVSG